MGLLEEAHRGDLAQPLRLQRMLPGAASVSVAELVEELGLWDRSATPPARPRVLLNMVSTVDGRATIDGISGGLGGAADRALFHGLRSAVDGVLVGAGTVRVERYGRIIKDESQRRLRVEHGLEQEPLACIVSAGMVLADDIPLFRERAARVVMITTSAAGLPACEASVEYVRSPGGRLDLHAAMAELRERFSVQTLLCEGGPHLARELLTEGLIDELLLCLSPLLAAGEQGVGGALGILAGAELEPAVQLELLGLIRCDSHLFLRYGLRYGVSARALVSRETIASSSLAS